jgi:membrane protease YdiL (CAAX protease family)
MKARVRAWMTGNPVLAFYLLTFAITWLAWFPAAAQSHGVHPFTSPIFTNPVLFIVGGLGPGVAAVVVMRALHGEAGRSAAVGRAVALACQHRLVGRGGVRAHRNLAGAAGLGGTLSSDIVRLPSWLAVLPSLLCYLLQAVPEEVGWREFALPRLQARYSALTAGLIVGCCGRCGTCPC